MPLELVDEDFGSYGNAEFLARAADLAYLPAAEGAEAFRNELALEAELVSVDNTQVYIGKNDTSLVVAFRGSQSPTDLDGLKDWLLTNANNFLVVPEGQAGTDFAAAGVGARFHRGFLEALDEIWQPMLDKVNAALDEEERLVWVAGHSLGGALALLAAWRLQRNDVMIHQVYTFGAPMIGNTATAEAFAKTFPDRIYRFIDSQDLVPRLPTMSLVANEYGHCLTEMPLAALQEAGEATEDAVGRFRMWASSAAGGLLDAALIESIWTTLKSGLSSHLMNNYIARIREKMGG